MSVSAIRLQNFMAFGEAADEADGWIELRPITLLFGRNSSGKSAIIRALRFLKQSLDHAPAGSPFAYKVEDGVDVGSFLEMAHGNNARLYHYGNEEKDWLYDEEIRERKRRVEFGFRTMVPAQILRDIIPVDDPDQQTEVTLLLGFGWLAQQQRAGLISLSIELPDPMKDENIVVFSAERQPQNAAVIGPNEWWYGSYDFVDQITKPDYDNIWPLVEIEPRNNGFLPKLYLPRDLIPFETEDVFRIRVLLNHINANVRKFLESIAHIRPMRPEPQRGYVLSDVEQQRWQRHGLGGFLGLIRDELEPYQMQELSYWLDQLDLGVSLESHRPFPERFDWFTVTQLMVGERDGAVRQINLVDMGFGASQVIPVLVQSILADPGSIVIIEQPELHLHPRAQARSADMFVNEIYTISPRRVDDNGKPIEGYRQHSGVKFLLETHSEHLLLRLQKRLIETAAGINEKGFEGKNRYLTLKDFNICFVQRRQGVSVIKPIQLNDLGEFVEFPDEFETFFADDLIEAGELAKLRLQARAKRREAGDNSSP